MEPENLTIKKNKTPKNILDSVAKYQKNNKDKINEKSRSYYQRLKTDPVRLAHFKERQKKNKMDYALRKLKEIVDLSELNESENLTPN